MHRSFVLFVIAFVAACGEGQPEITAAPAPARAETRQVATAQTSSEVIYFGQLEVMRGKLKTESGDLPKAGETAVLRFFVAEVAHFVEGQWCFAIGAHLYVRFNDSAPFQELPLTTVGGYLPRGPSAGFSKPQEDITLAVPNDADRIEVYAFFDRLAPLGGSCYMAYDMAECPETVPLAGDWVSNYWKNFAIGVGH